MKNKTLLGRAILAFLMCMVASVAGAQVKLNLNVAQRGVSISPTLSGLFFEDINHAADGGLYAELIRNRSFEDNASPDSWSLVKESTSSATMALVSDRLLNEAQHRALKWVVTRVKEGSSVGISNTGFWGINAVKDRVYKLSFWAKSETPFRGSLTASLESKDYSKEYAHTVVNGTLTTQWQQFTAEFTASGNDGAACFVLRVDAPVTLYLDVVSLFPPTFNNRENGCRPELAQLLKDMHPKFLRFPGGCFVEGNSKENGFYWKKTVGPIEQREGHFNQWGGNKPETYRSSDGLGYHEYLQLSEDLGAASLYVVNVGIWHGGYVPANAIGTYVQDALDAIEYARGDASTRYGAMRIANGHPEPFDLHYVEVGNENYQVNASQQSNEYANRYIQFYNAIKAKYPDIQIIGNVEAWGTDDPSWRNGYPVDLLDEHYYRNPSWFVRQYSKYDTYSRAGAKIYAGEYAVTSECGKGNLNAALGEAVYMLGMENNSDVVAMHSYAPIFKNENTNDWEIDMIHFDSENYYCTPSYYVQQLFSTHIGTQTVRWTEENNHSSVSKVGVGTWATVADFDDVQVRDASGQEVLLGYDFSEPSGWLSQQGTWIVKNGVFSQTTTGVGCTAMVPESLVTDTFTYTLRARKKSGNEGFLVVFNYDDANNYCWWNLGGWGNTSHGIEQCIDGNRAAVTSVPGSLITGKWYDIRIEVVGTSVRCFIDDQLIHTAMLTRPRKVYTAASVDEKTGELVVKMVNPSAKPADVQLLLSGASSVTSGTVTVLSSVNGTDENSMNVPERIKPQKGTLTINGLKVSCSIPAYSVNITQLNLADITTEEPTPETPNAPLLHYSFEQGTRDDSGNGYDASLKGAASIVDWKGNKVLRLTDRPGYLDMACGVGRLVSSLSDFTISAKVRLGDGTDLNRNGNFLWSFSNSEAQLSGGNGYFFFGVNVCEHNITKNDFSSATLLKTGSKLQKNVWKCITYTQKEKEGILYVDGVKVASGAVGLQPRDLGATLYNWLGRSCYSGDGYLTDAYIDEFKIYDAALSPESVAKENEDLAIYNSAFSEEEAVKFDSANCHPSGFLTEVREGVILPLNGMKGSKIQWESGRPDLMSAEGKVLRRPSAGSAGEELVLTATFTKGKASVTRDYRVTVAPDDGMQAYLMVYFKDESHSVYLALSADGYLFTDVNNGKPVIGGDTIAVQGGVRDPHLLRGADGAFYLSLTDLNINKPWERPGDQYGWGNNRDLVLMKSTDLIHWSRTQLFIDELFPNDFGNVGCAWAPQTFWDADSNRPMIYFSMRPGNGYCQVYYTYMNADYNRMETTPKQIFRAPDNLGYIDSDINRIDGKYYMYYVPSEGTPGIRVAVSDLLTSGYVYDPDYVDTENNACEAPNLWRRINSDKWVLMYDCYGISPHNFAFRETSDLINWKDLGYLNGGVMKTSNYAQPKHGAVIHLKAAEANELARYWGSPFRVDDPLGVGDLLEDRSSVQVSADDDCISITSDCEGTIFIYTSDGILKQKIVMVPGIRHIPMDEGYYLVKVITNISETYKVVVF